MGQCRDNVQTQSVFIKRIPVNVVYKTPRKQHKLKHMYICQSFYMMYDNIFHVR